MTYTALESALVAWVQAATGLSADSVYLANQNLPSRFPVQSAILSLGDIISQGADDELRWDFDAGRPAGTEVHFNTNGWRTCTVTVTFFSTDTAGDSTARALANQAMAALRLPSQRAALNAAGLGVMDEGNVRWVPFLDSGRWWGQAVLEVGLSFKATATESVGYISTYEATGTVSP